MSFEFVDDAFQLLTPGLYTGDPLEIRINYQIRCSGVLCFTGWMTRIEGKIGGFPISNPPDRIEYGRYGGGENVLLKAPGKMSDKDIGAELTFCAQIGLSPLGARIPIATKKILIPNLSEIVPLACVIDADCPSGYRCVGGVCIPAVTCIEGETQCRGTDLYICKNGKFELYEENSKKCGYTPPDEEEKIVNWIEKYKWVIIGASVAVIIGVIVFIVARK